MDVKKIARIEHQAARVAHAANALIAAYHTTPSVERGDEFGTLGFYRRSYGQALADLKEEING